MGCGAASLGPPTSCDSEVTAAMAAVAMLSAWAAMRTSRPRAKPIDSSATASATSEGGVRPSPVTGRTWTISRASGVIAKASAMRMRPGSSRSPQPGMAIRQACTRR